MLKIVMKARGLKYKQKQGQEPYAQEAKMELKDVFAKLEGVDGGADLITAIKTEIQKINGEAAKNRTEGKAAAEKAEAVAKKMTAVLSALEIEDGEDLEDKVSAVKATLDGIKAKGGKPDEVLQKFGKMEKEMKTLQEQLKAATTAQEAERAKRMVTVKQSLAIDALTKGNAANPKEMAKLIMDNIGGEDDGSLVYKNGDKEMSIEEGTVEWLKENPWAVKVDPKGGGGSGGAGGKGDAFMDGFASELATKQN